MSPQLDSVCGKFCEGPSGRTVLPWNKTDNVSYFTSLIGRCILGTSLFLAPLQRFSWSICSLRYSSMVYYGIVVWSQLAILIFIPSLQVIFGEKRCTIRVPINSYFPSVIKVAAYYHLVRFPKYQQQVDCGEPDYLSS